MDKEIWKDIEGYEGLYQVSNFGKVRSLVGKNGYNRILILKPTKDKNGYFNVSLYKSTKKICRVKVHRLVAGAFISNPENKPTVNHINGIKTDNTVKNLEWATRSEQTIHAFKNDLMKKCYGEASSNAKLTDKDAILIRKIYVPYSRKYGTYALAKRFGVGPDAIDRVIKRKTFKHI